MYKLITYAKDSKAMITEVDATHPELLSSPPPEVPKGKFSPRFLPLHTPTIKLATSTLSVILCSAEELVVLQGLVELHILAQAPIGADLLATMSPNDRRLYDFIRLSVSKPSVGYDGKPITLNIPALIGAIA